MSGPALSFDGPLDPNLFLGRKNVLDQVFGRLNGPEFLSSSIVGGPRTGKTSILRYIASQNADPHSTKSLRVYVDAEPLGGQATAADFWISAFRAIKKLAPSPLLESTLTRAKAGQLDLYDLEDLFDDFASNQTPLVIAIDNFAFMLNNANFWPPVSDFFHVARSLAQRLPHGVAYVTATTRPLLDLWDPTRSASPYYNIFANILVSRMTDQDIVAIVNHACASAGVTSNQSLIDLVTAASDRHPALVGRVARFLAARLAAKQKADEDSLAEIADDPNGPYISLSRQIRASLEPRERQLVDSLGAQKLSDANRRLLSLLQDYGLLPLGTEF